MTPSDDRAPGFNAVYTLNQRPLCGTLPVSRLHDVEVQVPLLIIILPDPLEEFYIVLDYADLEVLVLFFKNSNFIGAYFSLHVVHLLQVYSGFNDF